MDNLDWNEALDESDAPLQEVNRERNNKIFVGAGTSGSELSRGTALYDLSQGELRTVERIVSSYIGLERENPLVLVDTESDEVEDEQVMRVPEYLKKAPSYHFNRGTGHQEQD